MYYNKFEANNFSKKEKINPIEITNNGVQGVMESTSYDYEQSCIKANELSGYSSEREMAIADEHRRETEIFQKVLTKKSR